MVSKFVTRMLELFDEIIVRVWITPYEVCFKLTDDCIYKWTVEDFHEHNKAKQIWTVLSSVNREIRRNAR